MATRRLGRGDQGAEQENTGEGKPGCNLHRQMTLRIRMDHPGHADLLSCIDTAHDAKTASELTQS
jgi:hypothetical protein